MKHAEEIMQILEAFDLTHSLRDAGELAGCSPNTVAHWVTRRDAGELTATAVRRPQLIDEFLPKLEALGHAAVAAGRRVAWFSLESLGVLVRRHRADDSVTRAMARILRAALVVVDLSRPRDYPDVTACG